MVTLTLTSVENIWQGVQGSFRKLKEEVESLYGVKLTRIGCMGISAMMHGYMAFDKEGHLLTPFRTWRNTMTQESSRELSKLFKCNIPQRWSITHLYQAILATEQLLMTSSDSHNCWRFCSKRGLISYIE